MNKPVCSVVVTCYNYARFLPICLESVLKQTYQHFEIIVVNDGSTDNTDEVIEPYIKDPRIHYIKQQNAGQAHAKNTGIRNAKGLFIAFLDADDLWVESKLDEQLPLFDDPKVGVVYSTSRYIDEYGEDFPLKLESKYMRPRSGDIARYLFFDNFVPFSSSVVRKECFNKVGVFNESISMGIDWDLWLRISIHFHFQYVKKPLLLYRIGHAGQMSKNLEERLHCADHIIQEFLVANPSLMTPYIIRKMWYYTYVSRGKYLRKTNMKMSNEYFIKAFLQWPLSITAVKGLLKNMLLGTLRFS